MTTMANEPALTRQQLCAAALLIEAGEDLYAVGEFQPGASAADCVVAGAALYAGAGDGIERFLGFRPNRARIAAAQQSRQQLHHRAAQPVC